MSFMADVLKFPTEGPSDDKSRYVSLGFAAAAVAVSILAATVTGSLMMGRTEADLQNVIDTQRRDHDEITSSIRALVANVGVLSAQTSSQGSQLEALKQLITQERADRLDMEQRLYNGTRPK